MEFRIKNFTWDNNGLFGEDMVCFNFDIETDDGFSFTSFIHLRTLHEHLNEHNPALSAYMDSVRNGIVKWGPAEGVLMRELNGEVDFEKITTELFEQKGWFVSGYERFKQMAAMPKEEHKKVQRMVGEMERGQKSLHNSTKEYYEFCETADKILHELALKMYPEILDMDEVQLKKFRYLFYNEIVAMQKRLKELLKVEQNV